MNQKTLFIVFTIIFFLPNPLIAYPVTVSSCDRQVVFESAPERAVSNDINLTEIMLALDLEKHMIGFSGVRNKTEILPILQSKLSNLAEVSPDYATTEDLLGINADFYFAGWNYGLRVNGEVSPENLGRFGIKVYELTESCIHLGEQQEVTLQTFYTDVLNLGKIFGVQDRAVKLVSSYQKELDEYFLKYQIVKDPIKVFVYDSGEAEPFTAGRYAMPNALIKYAGGVNVMEKIDRSWVSVSFEEVIEENPEWIIIVNYGNVTAEQKKDFLRNHPALTTIQAIQEENFLILDYSEVTPGPRNINAIKKIVNSLWGS